MELARRTRWIVSSLPVALVAVAALARPAPPGVLAAAAMVSERACPLAGEASGGGGALDGASAWYRLDATLDAGGTLVGRRLVAGRGSARWTAQLPAESFASGPVGGRVLVGDDDGHRSRLRLLDTARGCWAVVGTEDDVIRSALLAADGGLVYEHRVDRGTRHDLGVWARDVPALDVSRQVLTGLAADPVIGPTFSTTLLLADDGRIAVSSCGERACRTRVADLATGAASAVVVTGPAAGVAGGQLVALEPCEGLPCPMQAIDLASGARSSLGPATGAASLAPDGSGLLVLAGERGLRVGRASEPQRMADVPDTPELAPIPRTSTSETGFEAPSGLVPVAPGGSAADPSLVRLLDPASLQITAGEVLP
jgi:hypothetical protein